MKRRENDMIPVLHRDMILFREALNYTAAETLFSQRLIEKDIGTITDRESERMGRPGRNRT